MCMFVCVCVYTQFMKRVELDDAHVTNTEILQSLQILLWWYDLYMCLCVCVCVCVGVYTVYEAGAAGRRARDQYWDPQILQTFLRWYHPRQRGTIAISQLM